MTEGQKGIAVAATFTAEPLEDALRFWMRELSDPMDLAFAPYNQLFAELADPASLLARNQGFNVLLVRPADWLRFQPPGDGAAAEALLDERTRELTEGIRSLARRSSATQLVFLCPDPPSLMSDDAWRERRGAVESRFRSELERVPGVHVGRAEELSVAYPVSDFHDAYRDEIGHVPFTPLYFAALGTWIMRTIHALRRPPGKVLALDCDETLWKGVCAEDGVDGIVVDAPRRALQEFAVARHAAGMLVTLCSRNREEDVTAVLDRREEMVLRREHLAGWRLNWRPKSENLRSIAAELGVGLDSVIFVDDDPVVCAEVEANCPEVLTLRLPEQAEQIPRFLSHVWAFDRLGGTAEDARRTQLYRQEKERERYRSQSQSFEDFLSGLALEVSIEPMRAEQLARVAQLTSRTNQFNVHKRPASEAEIGAQQAAGREILTVEVRDRFGDYGLVGVIGLHPEQDALRADTFLLSCRVLGRGVEHRMLYHLGRLASARGLRRVDVLFTPSPRNDAALDFLEGAAAGLRHPREADGAVYRIPAETAASIRHEPAREKPDGPERAQGEASAATVSQPVPAASRLYRRIALDLSRPEEVLEAMAARGRRPRPDLPSAFVSPATRTERELATLWGDLLRVEPIGAQDDFFALGGHSLLATLLLTRVRDRFGVAVGLAELFDGPTIVDLARAIDSRQIEDAEPSEIEALLEEVGRLSDEEARALLAGREP